jgi:hypothetical protein
MISFRMMMKHPQGHGSTSVGIVISSFLFPLIMKNRKWSGGEILLHQFLTPLLPRHGNNDPDDNMDLEMALMVDLGDCENCQKIKRVAIPESHTNWTVFFSDANNISEILVYVPIDGGTYKRFDRVEESYADGIRFNIELTEFRSQGGMTADNEEQEMIKTLDYAVEDVQKNMELDPDVSWDDHSVQPIIRKMSLKLLELRQ